MDRRELAEGFRTRFKQIIETESGGVSRLLREIGMDRSALSHFMDPTNDRLPRAEMLRRIAEARGVSTDWLLCLENAPEGRQTLSSSYQIEEANSKDGSSPLDRWHEEASGHKLRYVPSALPDMLDLTSGKKQSRSDFPTSGAGTEHILSGTDLDDRDIEIAMPIEVIQDLATQSGLWREVPSNLCKEQLEFMATTCRNNYPALRLHLFSGKDIYSAPFTVFGKLRAAVYIGDAYLVITTSDQVKAFVKKFDELVRRSVIEPKEVHRTLQELADSL